MACMYIHIPFCLGKCAYCSFNSYAGMEGLYPRYVEAVKKELSRQRDKGRSGPLHTLFFGGGTPSVLEPASLCAIIDHCRELFGFTDDIEISLEANPKSVDFIKMITLRQAGVNRLSIGVQSFLDNELDILGRLHSAQNNWDCIRDAVAGGFENISVDLMYGLPYQKVSSWQWNLEIALALGVSHLSLYQLTLEDGTRMQKRVAAGEMVLPDEEEILKMDEVTRRLLSNGQAFRQYEIANYALNGYFCKHNLNYWHNNEYYAAGAGAVAYVNGTRSRNISHPSRYCEMVENEGDLFEESETLTLEESFRETVIMGLRMVEGIDLDLLFRRYNIDFRSYYGEYLNTLVQGGLGDFEQDRFRLTAAGRQVANQILAELV